MDQEALVDRFLEAGARLDIELRRRGFTLGSPIAAYDLNAGQWTLVFGLPAQMSRRQVYEMAQAAIVKLGLRLDLDNVALVKDADPGMQELRELAVSSRGPNWESSASPIEVGGKVFSNPQTIRISPLQFENAVWQALHTVLSNRFELRRDYNPRSSNPEFEPSQTQAPRLTHVDFAALSEDVVVLIEVKATRRPLSGDRVLSALGQLTYYRHQFGYGRPVSLVLVSMTGFSEAVKHEFETFEGLVLTTWTVGQDETILADAVARAANSNSPF